MDSDKTHFGYQTVNKTQKASLVGEVFDTVAQRYDLMNDLMSLGIHRFWKRYAVWLANIRSGQAVLDLAGGTGDLAKLALPALAGNGRMVIADINGAMLEVGRRRLLDQGQVHNVEFVRCDAECLPFAAESFDCVMIGFGLRNMTDKRTALEAVQRALKPGGKLVILEFSKADAWLETCYRRWSFGVIPRIGRWIAGDEKSYRYLVESIRMHPDQNTLLDMMSAAGFDKCEYFNLSCGISAVHRGYKLQ